MIRVLCIKTGKALDMNYSDFEYMRCAAAMKYCPEFGRLYCEIFDVFGHFVSSHKSWDNNIPHINELVSCGKLPACILDFFFSSDLEGEIDSNVCRLLYQKLKDDSSKTVGGVGGLNLLLKDCVENDSGLAWL